MNLICRGEGLGGRNGRRAGASTETRGDDKILDDRKGKSVIKGG